MSNQYLSISEIVVPFKAIWINEVERFEKTFAEYVGCQYALATSYGRTALYLALRAINVQGKEVMVSALTCSVVRSAIILAGAKPVFLDVNPVNLDIVLSDAKKKLTDKTAAMIFIHYYGAPANNIEEIQSFAKDFNLILIEDCAHSLGAEYCGKKLGNFGNISIFSLTKNTLNFGGGMLCTNNRIIYEKAKSILLENKNPNYLQKLKILYFVLKYGYYCTVDKVVLDRIGKAFLKRWLINIPGIICGFILKILKPIKELLDFKKDTAFYSMERNDIGEIKAISNLEMHPIIASVGIIQLRKVDNLNSNRIEIARKLENKVRNYCKGSWNMNINSKSVYTNFPFWFEGYNINELVEKCKLRGFLLRKSWPASQTWWDDQDTESIRKIRDNLLLLTINPQVTDKEIELAGEIVRQVLRGR
jgi:dTDP-4-amino-4,6-dideoxygalactose transaminase